MIQASAPLRLYRYVRDASAPQLFLLLFALYYYVMLRYAFSPCCRLLNARLRFADFDFRD